MEEELECELYREDGEEFRSVRLDVTKEKLRLSAHDMGKSVEKVWGSDDYEFWVDVSSPHFSKLLFALVREKYHGQADAVDALTAFCAQEGIAHDWQSWT